MPSLAALRLLWRRVHLWIGAGLLIAIIPLSFTGAVLVWRDGLERVLEPQRFRTEGSRPTLLASAYLQAGAQAMQGRATPAQIRFPGPDGGPVVVTGRGQGRGLGGNVSVWLDPQTAAVRDMGAARGGLHQALHELHGNLMIPEIGRKVVGWIGWAMSISCLTGLWLWWPLRGGVWRGFRFSRGFGTLFNLHHLIGFWLCVPLAVLSLTGVYISFPQTSRALFGVAQPAPPPGAGAPGSANPARRGGEGAGPRREGGPPGQGGRPMAHPALSPDRAAVLALEARPGVVTQISLPTEGRRPAWRVQVRPQGSAEPVNLSIDDQTGQARIARSGPGVQDPLSRWMRRLHDGGNLPLLWKWVITLGGLAPVFLSITGVVMWLQRRNRTAPVRLQKPAELAAE